MSSQDIGKKMKNNRVRSLRHIKRKNNEDIVVEKIDKIKVRGNRRRKCKEKVGYAEKIWERMVADKDVVRDTSGWPHVSRTKGEDKEEKVKNVYVWITIERRLIWKRKIILIKIWVSKNEKLM